MDQLMTQEESYADRRQLFKNIWETALHVDEKDDIMNKPKVIKTLRLDEVDKCVIGKKKKQRIKNLRNVCNKILDFCDRQDADDIFYEQVAAEGQVPPQQKLDLKPKKLKRARIKRKINKVKSLFSPFADSGGGRRDAFDRKDFPNILSKTSRNTAPINIKRTDAKKTDIRTRSPRNPRASPTGNIMAGSSGSGTHRKVIKKKISKRTAASTHLPGILDWPEL